MHTLLVLGNALGPDGNMTPRFQAYCNVAVDIATRLQGRGACQVVVSGGETVAGKPTEADVGAQYIERILPAVVVRERRARTTPDNVTFTLALLRPPVDVLTIIGRRTQLWRVRAILWRRRDRLRALGSPEVRTMSVDGESLVTAILDMVLLPVDLLDPLGRSFVYRLLKKVARNG